MIHLENVSKRFRSTATSRWPWSKREEVTALEGVTLSVERGDIFALVGTNGAGKSTLLKILAGLIIPETGIIEVDGFSLRRPSSALRRRVSFSPGEDRGFYARLTARQNLDFFGALYNLSKPLRAARIAQAAEQMQLTTVLDRPFQELSSGMRQRVALARAVLQRADIFLLDEPTRSLDPLSRLEFHKLLRSLAGPGRTTILLATHDLHEAQEVANCIGFLHDGRFRAAPSAPQDASDLQRQLRDFSLSTNADHR